MKKNGLKWIELSCLLGVVAILTADAETSSVVISPQNTAPTVKYYSNTAGEVHGLTVSPAAGYKFKDAPTLQLNPNGLWSDLGGNAFGLANMDGTAQHSAVVHGSIVPINGSGPGAPIPFDVSMITHYFTMNFVTPSTGLTEVDEGGQLAVSVVLVNAIGAPSTGTVNFSSPVGSFAGSTTVSGGVASSLMTVTGTVGMTASITANASNVDITAGQKATGSKQSGSVKVVEDDTELIITLLEPTEAVLLE